MRCTRRLTWVAPALMILVGCGCQNWKAKYEACSADLADVQASLDTTQDALTQCNSTREQLSAQIGTCRQDLAAARQAPAPAAAATIGGEKAVWDQRKGTLTVTLTTDVLFDSGQATLKSAAKKRLDRIAQEIRSKYADKEISVVGHTDTDPIRVSKWKDNWELSAQRALAVTRYLIAKGVPAVQLAAAGRAEFHPRATKAQSRRVEIVVHTY